MRESTTHSTDIRQVTIYRCSKYHGLWMTPEGRMCSPALKKCMRVRGTERCPSAPLERAQRNAKLQRTNTLGLRIKGMSEAWAVKEGFMEEVAMSLEI